MHTQRLGMCCACGNSSLPVNLHLAGAKGLLGDVFAAWLCDFGQGNYQSKDPTEQVWTAQAETSSVMAGLRLAQVRRWSIGKLDVKGAFKLLWVDPSDVGTFATDLPWQPTAWQPRRWSR